MNPKFRITLVVVALLMSPWLRAAESPSSEKEILKHLMDRVKENEEIGESYGYFYEAKSRELDRDSKVLSEETRLYRIVWVEDKPFFELLKVNGRDMTAKDKAEEAERRSKFIKAVREKKMAEYKLSWDELFTKFDYKIEPPEGDATYVVSFLPKKKGLQERTRMEKVFNHIAGKVWADSDYNITKAHLWLVSDVRFGLGILGNLDELELQYSQQKYANLWFPATMRLNYAFRILVKGRHQQLESRFFDIYPRPNH